MVDPPTHSVVDAQKGSHMELASFVSAVSLTGLFLHPPQFVSPEAAVPQC